MRFKPGQEVVCIVKAPDWRWGTVFVKLLGFIPTNRRKKAPGPKYNEVVTVIGYNSTTHCFFKEYGLQCAYPEDCFSPVLTTEELNEALADVPETISI